MSFFDSLRAFLTGSGKGRGSRLYIVDAGQFAGGNQDRVAPREQVQILQQLARFAQKESIKIQAVFEGRALREVEHGGEFEGVTVFFADKTSSLHELVVKLMRDGQRSKCVTVITSNSQLERRVMENGGNTLRISTFRKGMDNAGGGSGGGDRQDRGERNSQRRRQRSRRNGNNRNQKQQQEAVAAVADAGGGNGSRSSGQQDPVRDLIDLVE